jgi:hypothetical protein
VVSQHPAQRSKPSARPDLTTATLTQKTMASHQAELLYNGMLERERQALWQKVLAVYDISIAQSPRVKDVVMQYLTELNLETMMRNEASRHPTHFLPDNIQPGSAPDFSARSGHELHDDHKSANEDVLILPPGPEQHNNAQHASQEEQLCRHYLSEHDVLDNSLCETHSAALKQSTTENGAKEPVQAINHTIHSVLHESGLFAVCVQCAISELHTTDAWMYDDGTHVYQEGKHIYATKVLDTCVCASRILHHEGCKLCLLEKLKGHKEATYGSNTDLSCWCGNQRMPMDLVRQCVFCSRVQSGGIFYNMVGEVLSFDHSNKSGEQGLDQRGGPLVMSSPSSEKASSTPSNIPSSPPQLRSEHGDEGEADRVPSGNFRDETVDQHARRSTAPSPSDHVAQDQTPLNGSEQIKRLNSYVGIDGHAYIASSPQHQLLPAPQGEYQVRTRTNPNPEGIRLEVGDDGHAYITKDPTPQPPPARRPLENPTNPLQSVRVHLQSQAQPQLREARIPLLGPDVSIALQSMGFQIPDNPYAAGVEISPLLRFEILLRNNPQLVIDRENQEEALRLCGLDASQGAGRVILAGLLEMRGNEGASATGMELLDAMGRVGMLALSVVGGMMMSRMVSTMVFEW